jgi:hypothetical protein
MAPSASTGVTSRPLTPIDITVEQLRGYQYQILLNETATAMGMAPEELDPQTADLISQDAATFIEALLMEEDKTPLIILLQSIDPTIPKDEATRAAKALARTGTATYRAPRSQGRTPHHQSPHPLGELRTLPRPRPGWQMHLVV